MSKTSKSLLALAGFGLVTAGAAWYASRYSRGGYREDGHRDLRKPSFMPPEEVFPMASTAVYALIAYSGWRVWSAESSFRRNRALRLWISQLVANAQWSKAIFGQRSPVLALADVFALEASIIGYITAAHKVDRTAAYAFVPYAAWVAFTTALNAEILRLNPDLQ
jgi:translocator protein